jgi:hypothetical protein
MNEQTQIGSSKDNRILIHRVRTYFTYTSCKDLFGMKESKTEEWNKTQEFERNVVAK